MQTPLPDTIDLSLQVRSYRLVFVASQVTDFLSLFVNSFSFKNIAFLQEEGKRKHYIYYGDTRSSFIPYLCRLTNSLSGSIPRKQEE
jgi:hypothetical protein